jgi:diguanylate cyclase (GGDEF)-like protein
MRLTLYGRFLLVVVPAFVALAGVGTAMMSRFDSSVGAEALAMRVGNLGARVASALERHDALPRRRLAEDLLGMFGNDPAVVCVEARRQPGAAAADATYPPSVGCTGMQLASSLTLPVGDDGAQLMIAFSDAEIAAAARTRGWLTLAVVALAALAALGSATVGYRLIIGRRLKRLHDAMAAATEQPQAVVVDPGAHDELGDIVAAYNELSRRMADREQQWQERHALLTEESRRDALTGAYNRRHFEATVIGGDAASRRRAGVAVLIDLDHFKRVNDTHGHLVGDEVLVDVARRLTTALRPNDQLVRWGGEEFLVYADGELALEPLATRLHQSLSSTPLATTIGPLRVTASIGMVRLPLRAGDFHLSIERVIVLADRALYAAKAAGRHRTVGIQSLQVNGLAQLAAAEDALERSAADGLLTLVVVDGAAVCPEDAAPAATAPAQTELATA